MNETKKVSKITLQGARLRFRNFSGKEKENGNQIINSSGERNFAVDIDDDLAEVLTNDGWNIKYLKPNPKKNPDNPEYRQPYLSVKVRFDKYPPNVVLINNKGKIKLTEDTINQLDWSYIINTDLVISPYPYPAANDRPAGIAAYLRSMWVTVKTDELEEKYSNIPWIGESEEEEYINDEDSED